MGSIFADIDGDGIAEEITFDALAATQVKKGGVVIWSSGAYFHGPAGTWNRHPADVFLGADLDNDGKAEIVVFNNWDLWTGVLRWTPGVGLGPVWKSASPLSGPAGSWNRRNDEMSVVGVHGGLAIAVTSPANDWHGLLTWQPSPPPGRLELAELTNVSGAPGALVSKWTYLVDLVEITGTVMPPFDSHSVNVRLDDNYAHLAESVRGSAGLIHCETYPQGICFGPPGQIVRQVPWALPEDPVAALTVRLPSPANTAGATRALQAYDRVRIRGRLLIENGHPVQNGQPAANGGNGWVFLELHPYDYRNIRLVGVPASTEVVRETLVLVAPLYDYTVWENSHSSRVWIWNDGGLFHSGTSAHIKVMAPDTPPPGIDPSSSVHVRETVVHNGTGQVLDAVRQISNIQGGIEVRAALNAPLVQRFGAVDVADVNDPANDRSVLVIEYDVAWVPLPAGRLRHTVRVPQGWTAYGDVNVQIGEPGAIMALAAASDPAGAAQFILSASTGRVWHTVVSGAGWTPAVDLTDHFGYLGRVGAVAAVSASPGEVQFLMSTDDGSLWLAVRTAFGWIVNDVSAQIGIPAPAVAMAATSAGPDEAEFLLATADGHLWHTMRTRQGWQPVGDVNAQIGDPGPVIAVAATSAASDEAQFLLATADGHLWHTMRTPQGWQPVGDVNAQIGGRSWRRRRSRTAGPGPVVAVAATSAAPNEAQFLLATADGHLWHTMRTPQGWQPAGDVNAQIGDPGPVIALAATSAPPGRAQFLFSTR